MNPLCEGPEWTTIGDARSEPHHPGNQPGRGEGPHRAWPVPLAPAVDRGVPDLTERGLSNPVTRKAWLMVVARE